MFSMSKILLPTDFSPGSLDVARASIALAAHFGSEIILLHVLATQGAPDFGASLADDGVVARKRVEAERQLSEFLNEGTGRLIVKRVVVEGDVAEQIVRYADAEKVDLVCMPTHGHGAFRRLLLGSITAKVLHDANCPVWTGTHTQFVGQRADLPCTPRQIACAIDLGHRSDRVIGWANRLACEFGAALNVIHVVVSLDPRQEDYYLSPEWRAELIETARSEMKELLETTGVIGKIAVEIGPVPAAVAASAKLVKADMLVIGRSRGNLGGHLPTNAYAIIRDSPCPVLSV